jgi:hypothetical protein
MDRDTEQLNLLAIFHYVVAGLGALRSFFPLLYTTIGAVFIFAARHGTAKPGEDLPPEFLGWIFTVVGSLLFLMGIAMAIFILIAGRSLALRKRYSFAFVMACIRMPVRSVWNNPRCFYDCCALARISSEIILHGKRVSTGSVD